MMMDDGQKVITILTLSICSDELKKINKKGNKCICMIGKKGTNGFV